MCVCVCVCSCVYIVGQSNHMNKEIKSDTFKVNLGLKMEPLVVQKGKEGQDRFLQADVGILAQLWVSEQINACCCSVTKSCQTFCDSKDCSMPGSSVLCYLPDLLKFMSIESVMLSNHRSLCHPFLLLPSLFPNIRVFSNESALCISWLKYRSFSFSKSVTSADTGAESTSAAKTIAPRITGLNIPKPLPADATRRKTVPLQFCSRIPKAPAKVHP